VFLLLVHANPRRLNPNMLPGARARERQRSIGTEFRWISVCSNSSSRWVVVGCSWNQPPSINTPHSSKIASLFSCRSSFFLFFWVGLFVFHLTFSM
jgi:hypothetical protein